MIHLAKILCNRHICVEVEQKGHQMYLTRRDALIGSIAALGLSGCELKAQSTALDFLTAGQGSSFLPYGQGIAQVVNAQGSVMLTVKETKGSIENLSTVNITANAIGTAFLGSAYEAVNGIGPFADRKHTNLRAIAPMYETSFQLAAKLKTGIKTVTDLAGKRVGVGPAGGPAEAFFKGLMEVKGINAIVVTGTSAELETAYLSDGIDAFWQGAITPIPALQRMANQTDSTVFGLTKSEVELMLKRFPYLATADVSPGIYKGQTDPISSVAAWNIIIAHKDLPDNVAYTLSRAILSSSDIVIATKGSGASTRPENANKNRVVPYHIGAVRYLKQSGFDVN